MRTFRPFAALLMLYVGCGGGSGDPDSGELGVAVSPVTLSDVDDACYRLAVNAGTLAQTVAGTAPLVWSEAGLCADRFGDGSGGLAYVGTCDASAPINTVSLVLERLCSGGSCSPALATDPLAIGAGTYVNPCPASAPCRREAPCRPNVDSAVAFDLTIMRDAGQGFFDIAIGLDTVSCAAKLDCADPVTGTPRALLFDGEDRGPTAVLALVCSAGAGADVDTVLSFEDIVITCSDGWRAIIDPSTGTGGNFYTPSRDADIFQVATYEGGEATLCNSEPCNLRYWNVAIGVRWDDLIAHHGDCRLTTRATVSDGPLVGGETPAGWVYPVLEFDVPLTGVAPATGQRALLCRAHGLDEGGGVTTHYVGPAPEGPFCNDFDGETSARDASCPVCATESWTVPCDESLCGCPPGPIGGVRFPDMLLDAGNNVRRVAAADLDVDSRPDIAVANYVGDSRIGVFRATDYGGFGPHEPYAAGPTPSEIEIADLDGNGHPDIVTTNYGTDTMSVFLAVGDGTFAAQAVYPTGGNYPGSAAIGDFDEDGTLDVVVTNAGSASIGVFLNQGDGTFAGVINTTVSTSPTQPAVGDFDEDGHLDVAVPCAAVSTIYVLLGSGDGTFSYGTSPGTGTWPSDIATADLDGDGNLDLAFVNYYPDETVGVYFGTGAGTFVGYVTYAGLVQPIGIAIADVDVDGAPDLGVANNGANTVSVLLNQGDGTFAIPAHYMTAPTGVHAASLGFADLDDDGRPELLGANEGTPATASVLWNVGDGELAETTEHAVGNDPRDVVTGDFDGDGEDDVASFAYGGTVTAYLGDGLGGLTSAVGAVVSGALVAGDTGDWDGDGNLDLVAVDSAGGQIVALLGDGVGGFTPTVVGATHASPSDVAAADLDDDGALDLVVPCSAAGLVEVWLGAGDGTFALAATYTTGTDQPVRVVTGDFDRDGALDLGVVSQATSGSGSVRLFVNDGAGAFSAAGAPIATADLTPRDAVAGDVDRDGALDLVVTNGAAASHSVSVFRNNGLGGLGSRVEYDNIGSAKSLAVADFNDDGAPDLAVGDATRRRVQVFLNDRNGTFVPPSSFAVPGGAPVALTAVPDLDGDGRVDLVYVADHGQLGVMLNR